MVYHPIRDSIFNHLSIIEIAKAVRIFQSLLLFFLTTTFVQGVVAQENLGNLSDKLNELMVDRPGIADMPFTVAPRDLQLETGFEFYKKPQGNLYLLPVFLFRTGLSKAAEFRVTVKNIREYKGGSEIRGISPLTVGIKTHIIEQRGWVPETDILANLVFPMGNSLLQPDFTGHDILLLFQNDFSEKKALNYNVGYLWDGFSNAEMFSASVCYNYLPTEKIGLFIEYFDFLRKKGIQEHGIDAGVTWLLWPMIQADFSFGLSLAQKRWNYFVATGISVRIRNN